MKRVFRMVSALLTIILLMGALSGCTKKEKETVGAPDGTKPPNSTTEAVETTGEKITLNTVSMFGATDPALASYNEMVAEFAAKYPNVEVLDESSASNEEWKSRIKADFAVGNEPDVILYFTDANSYGLIESGSFVDLETIRSEFPEFAGHINDHTYTTAPDGKQYAVPTRGFYEALFCNKDLFDKYNLELPTNWENLMTAIETFKSNDIVPFAISLSDVPHYMIEHLVMAAGGVEDHRIVPNSAEEIPDSWVTGMEQFEVLYNAGAFPVDVNSTTDSLTSELFYNKQAAMKVDGSWFMGGIEDKDNVVAMPFPSMTKDNSNDIIAGFTSGWYITKKAWDDETKRQACVDFIEMVSSPEFLQKITTVAPCDLPKPEEMTLLDQTGWDTFVNAKDRVDLPIDSRISGEAWSAWIDSVGDMVEGNKEPKEVLENVIRIYRDEK